MKAFTLTVTLLEDLHTGSGTGAGDYDAVLARDSQGRPVIPASHWLGVWRDNLAHYLRATGQQNSGCNQLFGRANDLRGSLVATALYCQSQDVEVLPWTSTARETGSRVPKENTLRTKEFIPAGTTFEAKLWLADDGLETTLATACRITDRLGARRQRGDGHLRATLKPIVQPARPAPLPTTHTIRLLLKAQDPVCLPTTGHPGNIIASECYIRGQVLRGAFVAWLLRQQQAEVAKQWLAADIKVSNAYPLPQATLPEGNAWLDLDIVPMPLHFGFPKPGGGGVDGLPWWAADENLTPPVDQFSGQTGGEKLKRPGDGDFLFSQDKGKQWSKFSSHLAQRMRNSPPTSAKADGVLFTQEEIPEHTLFLCDLQFPDTGTAKAVMAACAPLFNQHDCLSLGRGGAPVTLEKWACTSTVAQQPPSTAPDTLTITLTSDLIARSPNLGFYQSLTSDVLLGLCGVAPDNLQDSTGRSFSDYVEIHGFNAMTGLPRLPALAIRRGSALQITGAQATALRQALQKQDFLGERSQEGFGRFRLDFHPAITTPEKRPAPVADNPTENLYAKAQAAFDELPRPSENWPKLSQWQALRFNETQGKTLLTLIQHYHARLEHKKSQDNVGKIAWLKPGAGNRTWLAWLMGKLSGIGDGTGQRIFYRALLALIRRELRQQGDE